MAQSLRQYIRDSTSEPLKAGDVFADVSGAFHLVQYVNTSGAYAVPLAGINREINDAVVSFSVGGRTISVYSLVKRINPLEMGGNSQEYCRYVKLVAASKEGGMAKRKVTFGPGAQGVTFDIFDDSPVDESVTAEGHTAADESATPNVSETDVAKKAKKAAKPKTEKTVRACACGCGGETTGYFVPGHDARMHGWIKKLADGRIEANGKDPKTKEQVVPAAVIRKLQLTATAKGAKAGAPHFWSDDAK